MVVTFANRMIDRTIIRTQKEMFARIGIDIRQSLAEGVSHDRWIDAVMTQLDAAETVLFVDIDCFADNRAVVDEAVTFARHGGLFGCAQAANHLDGPRSDYAGPMFLCIAKQTWLDIGSPSARADDEFDVCARWSAAATRSGVPVRLLRPTSVAIPLWSLTGGEPFGIGTWYEGGIFHLFEARTGKHTDIFVANAERTLNAPRG
jgi:hypothetical protein